MELTVNTNAATSSWSGPLAAAAASVARAAAELGTSQWASVLRAWCVPYLFQGMEEVFKSCEDPPAKRSPPSFASPVQETSAG